MKKETYPKTPEIALKHSKDKGRQRKKKSLIIEKKFNFIEYSISDHLVIIKWKLFRLQAYCNKTLMNKVQ